MRKIQFPFELKYYKMQKKSPMERENGGEFYVKKLI